jgi:hypothetical protein
MSRRLGAHAGERAGNLPPFYTFGPQTSQELFFWKGKRREAKGSGAGVEIIMAHEDKTRLFFRSEDRASWTAFSPGNDFPPP